MQEDLSHTDAYDQRADSEAGDGVFDQVRRSGSQQGWRCPHAVVIVGRAEGFAVDVSIQPSSIGTVQLTIPCWLLRLSLLCGESPRARRGGQVARR
jgi:hypothetical protein